VGDLPESAPLDPGSRAYEGAVVEAVRRFQARHGQRPDGALRAEVVKELNVPLDRRVRQMELTP
jgi:murein L,D-transpeptidase YcbB/YkuD